jgi:hypothetical protein
MFSRRPPLHDVPGPLGLRRCRGSCRSPRLTPRAARRRGRQRCRPIDRHREMKRQRPCRLGRPVEDAVASECVRQPSGCNNSATKLEQEAITMSSRIKSRSSRTAAASANVTSDRSRRRGLDRRPRRVQASRTLAVQGARNAPSSLIVVARPFRETLVILSTLSTPRSAHVIAREKAFRPSARCVPLSHRLTNESYLTRNACQLPTGAL